MKEYLVIGNPITHSLSPELHNYWIRENGINGIYDKKKLNDKRIYSTFENTCPHITIFANSFFNSKCYIKSQPLSVNLSGEREWVDLYSFIELVRIPETLDFYFKSGLSFKKYYYKC